MEKTIQAMTTTGASTNPIRIKHERQGRNNVHAGGASEKDRHQRRNRRQDSLRFIRLFLRGGLLNRFLDDLLFFVHKNKEMESG